MVLCSMGYYILRRKVSRVQVEYEPYAGPLSLAHEYAAHPLTTVFLNVSFFAGLLVNWSEKAKRRRTQGTGRMRCGYRSMAFIGRGFAITCVAGQNDTPQVDCFVGLMGEFTCRLIKIVLGCSMVGRRIWIQI